MRRRDPATIFKFAKTCRCCRSRKRGPDGRIALHGRKTIYDPRSYARAGGGTPTFNWAHEDCQLTDNAFCLRSRVTEAQREYAELVEDHPHKEGVWRENRDRKITLALNEAVRFWNEIEWHTTEEQR